MAYLSDGVWEQYEGIINDFFGDIGRQPIGWRHINVAFDRYQEGDHKHQDTLIYGLLEYPFQRKWAIDEILPEGQADRMYSGLYLNVDYLRNLGLLNAEGYFDFNPALDRFYINGIWYTCYGNMHAAQVKEHPLYFILILERDEKLTGKEPAPTYDG